MKLRTLIIVFTAVIGTIHSHHSDIDESFDSSNVVDPKYRPWTYDNTSENWISLEGMGLSEINSVIRLRVPNLRWLIMDQNRISKVPTEAFKFMPDLTYISLAWNLIYKFGVDAFDGVEKVQVIDLDENPIRDMDSSKIFSTLPALERLYLRHCQLSYFDLPKDVRNLSHLYLSGNTLNSFQASSDSALTHVYLDDNNLYYVSLSHLKSLVYLDVSNNYLGSIISHEVFPYLHIQRLGRKTPYYQYSSHTGLFLGDAPSLQYLKLSSNNISEITADTFLRPSSLVHLNLTGNILSQVKTGAFNNLLQLKDIFLDSNIITTIEYRAFFNLPNLKTISLENNQISDIEEGAFGKLNSNRNDVHIFLDKNRIHTLRSNTFSGIRGLKHIGLSQNRIKIISSNAFVDLPNLNRLFIDLYEPNNHGSGYQSQVLEPTERVIESHAFFNLPNLILIKISGNVFTDIQAQAFDTLPELLLLDLSNNSIQHLSSEAFHDLPKIEDLDLSNNLLSEIEPKTFPKHLKRLNLAQNHECPDLSCWNVGGLHQLEELYIFESAKRLRLEDFSGLSKNVTVMIKNGY